MKTKNRRQPARLQVQKKHSAETQHRQPATGPIAAKSGNIPSKQSKGNPTRTTKADEK